jgi:hypothetical protein
VEFARLDGYPQAIQPALGTRALVLVSTGDLVSANALADELLKPSEAVRSAFAGPCFAIWTFAQLGRADEFISRLSGARRTPWFAAAEAGAAGDWLRAAEIYRSIGTQSDEAFALLQTGEDAHLRTALTFFRSVSATRYVREAEAQLAAIA